MSPRLACLACLALASCVGGTRPSPPPADTTVQAGFPISQRWEERERTATSATVVAHIERRTALDLPLVVTVRLPPQVEYLSGRLSFTLPPSTGPDRFEEVYRLTFPAIPEGDVVLLVDGEGAGAGYHGKDEYRFGRAPPPQPRVNAGGPAPHTRVPGSAGGSIPLP